MRWSGQTESDLKVGDRWPTGGRLGGCFAHCGPQRNSFHHTEIFCITLMLAITTHTAFLSSHGYTEPPSSQ